MSKPVSTTPPLEKGGNEANSGWKFDFSEQGTLDPCWRWKFDAVVSRCRGSFTSLTDAASRRYGTDIFWWVSELACRNTLTNSFFLKYCQIHFIRELLAEGEKIAEVRADSLEFSRVLEKCLEGYPARVTLAQPGLWCRVRKYLSQGKDFVIFFLNVLLRTVLATWVLPCRTPPPPPDSILTDIFVSDASFSNGRFSDRYYSHFGGFLDEEGQGKIVYAPTLMVRLPNLVPVLQSIRNAKDRFLLKEDVLRWQDLFWAFGVVFRILLRRPSGWTDEGIDFTPLARKVWRESILSPSSVLGLMDYRFAQRLKETKASFRMVIDWFENQIIDKGFNAGFRKFFPDIPHIGYEGYVTTPNYLCVYPSQSEFEFGVIPKTVAVIGPVLVPEMKDFCPRLDVIPAPALRFAWLWSSFTLDPDPAWFTVLVALDVTLEASCDILHCAMEAAKHGLPENFRFWVKPHPAAIPFDILLTRLGIELPQEFTVVSGDFPSTLRKCDMILSNTSTTCMEAVVFGIPAVIAGSRSGFSRNPIPAGVPKDLWRLCLTPEDTIQAMNYFSHHPLDRDARMSLGRQIRKDYFTEVTPESVTAFIALPCADEKTN